MTGILLGLFAGLTYGAADFIGGLASRRSSVFAVVVISQIAGLMLLLALIPIFPAAHPQRVDFLWGALAGLAGALGIVLLYRGLAIGRMSFVSPVTAVIGAVIPFLVGLAIHEHPSALATCGVLIALVAVVFVSSTAADGEARMGAMQDWLSQPGLLEAVLSGVGIGLFYVFLARSHHDSGMWPLATSRATSSFVVTLVALGTRQTLMPEARGWGVIILAGVLDVAANVFYLLATRHGLLAIVAVLASLYPASTVVLARLFLREHLTRIQLGGVVCALAAIALIGLGH